MINIPAKTKTRITAGIKKYAPILTKAQAADINESDTVTIITDMLSEIFGYAKYDEITSEYAIKKTFCDLAIKLDGTPRILIEVKSAGLNLREQHIRQAVDYGSNSGIDWVILTNGVFWKVYSIVYSKPVTAELLYEFDFTSLSTKKASDLEFIYILTKEAMNKSSKNALADYQKQKQVLNRFTIGQILLSDALLDAVRRNIKKVSPDAKITNDEIKEILVNEVIKRDVLDDDKSVEAKRRVTKALKATVKNSKSVNAESDGE